jgi:hypothetical protein
MRTLNRTLLAFAFSAVVAPAFAQSGANRTSGVPTPQPTRNVTIVETRDVRDCRVHCGSLAATPNGKTLPTATQTQMRTETCERKMLRGR